MRNRQLFIGLTFIYFLVVFRMAWMSYSDTYYNWDVIPYMAIVLSFHESDSTKIHTAVYQELAAAVPPETFRSYTDTTSHTGLIYRDPDKFFEYISFFQVKPLYVFLVNTGYVLGVPLIKAPLLPSVISFIGMAIFLFYWLQKIAPSSYGVLAGLLIIISSPMIEVLRLSTPDALSAFILLASFYLILNHFHMAWIIIFLSLSVLARVDNVIIACLMMVAIVVFRSKDSPNKRLILTAAGAIAAWLLYSYFIVDYANQSGGLNNFYGGIEKKLDPVVLFNDAVRGLPTLRDSSLSPLICIALFILFVRRKPTGSKPEMEYYFFCALVIHIVLKYIVLPDMWDRHYTATFAALIVLILRQIQLYWPESQTSSVK